jgi:hypothetical protein
MRPIALHHVYLDRCLASSRIRVGGQNILISSRCTATVGIYERERSPSLVGRPGLDPGTLGLKGTFHRLFRVGLVAHVHCFQGIALF